MMINSADSAGANHADASTPSSKAEKDKLIKLLLTKAQNSYRVIIDILVKLNQSQIDLTIYRDAGIAV